jgi:hypothetical protein
LVIEKILTPHKISQIQFIVVWCEALQFPKDKKACNCFSPEFQQHFIQKGRRKLITIIEITMITGRSVEAKKAFG